MSLSTQVSSLSTAVGAKIKEIITTLSGKQPLDADLTAIAGLAGTNGFLKKTALDTWVLDTSTYSLSSHNHTGTYEPIDATILRSANIGTTVQAYSANLASWSSLNTSAKQDTLISTTNIKTVNGVSILGSGNLTVETGDKTQTAVMTATQASSTTLIAGVTQLAIEMVANGVYKVDAFVTFKSSIITTGAKIGFTSPTGCMCMVDVVVPIASTANNTALKTTFPSAAVATNIGEVAGTGVTAINSNHTARINGIIRNGANAGNFQVTFASENSTSSITLQIGSVLQLTRVG